MDTITDYHAKYFTHELTKHCSSDNLEKLTSTLADAQVDLNPHQVEASLFAFRSPFSNGVTIIKQLPFYPLVGYNKKSTEVETLKKR